MIGLAGRNDVKNFFIYLAILINFAILMNAQLALFSSFATGNQVQVYASCTLLAMMLFGGFIIPPDAMPDYYLWVYWWNPFAWAYRGLVVNEFRSPRWDDPDQVLASAGFIDPRGVIYGQLWVGYSFAYMVGYLLLCCVLSAIGLTYIRHTGNVAPDPASKDTSQANLEEAEKVAIPFKPVTLSFHDICYEVTASTTKEQLSLLKSVNGVFRPGKMCALMVSRCLRSAASFRNTFLLNKITDDSSYFVRDLAGLARYVKHYRVTPNAALIDMQPFESPTHVDAFSLLRNKFKQTTLMVRTWYEYTAAVFRMKPLTLPSFFIQDVIALRKRSGTIGGEVRLNGWLQDPLAFRRCSGYVEQFDVQSPELTVRETVLFSARLRLDSESLETDEQKQAFVDHIIEEVELSELALALVGTDDDSGLSFEQKKRLSIAVELAASPSVIFLDEVCDCLGTVHLSPSTKSELIPICRLSCIISSSQPTTGLDARSASLVAKTLRKIADGNRTICATIHQPSSAIFGMFVSYRL
jgi:ABC-type cobalamin/Fe3+-siderophores transport system ATPase subunit